MHRQPSLAFGVEPRFAPYRLRQARYHALAETIARFIRQRGPSEQPLRLLDVGVWKGVSLRYLEAQADLRQVELHGVDRFPRGQSFVYKHEQWRLHEMDLEEGMPQLPSDAFDIVICEQVLEHLRHAPRAALELSRVLKPGGIAIIGVPIFWHGLHWLRQHAVPVVDRLRPRTKPRSHVQAFSLQSFRRLLRDQTDFTVIEARGYRIVSGGPLRALENYAWWWKLNRFIGSLVPSLCIETQIVATKLRASGFGQRRPADSSPGVHAGAGAARKPVRRAS